MHARCRPGLVVSSLVICTTLSSAAPVAVKGIQDPSVAEMVAEILGDDFEAESPSAVFKDERDDLYYALHISEYLDLREVRAYYIPFASTDVDAVDALLADGNVEAAFEMLIDGMRVRLGAKYVSDVNMDGIRDEDVALGAGKIRDRFHNAVFADFPTADKSYRRWLERMLELKRASS